MLEYFTVKKFRKNKAEKEANGVNETVNEHASTEAGKQAVPSELDKDRENKGKEPEELATHENIDENAGSDSEHAHAKPVLHPEDVSFLEQLLAREEEDGPAPPLPPRIYAHDLDWPSDNEGAPGDELKREGEASKTVEKDGKADNIEKGEKKPNRLSMFFTRHKKQDDGLKPEAGVAPAEAEQETKDLSRVLDRLNLSAKNNKVVSLTNDSSELLQNFTQVFKDLVNGVPTAVDDLTRLIEDRDGTIAKGFDKLPSSLKKLVTQLPEKLTNSLGPEILAAAAGSQGIQGTAEGGMKGAAKKLFVPQNLLEMVTKPGAIVSMLRAIVEVLKTRWPAFIGLNVLWGVALSCKLSILTHRHPLINMPKCTNFLLPSAPLCSLVLL